MFTGIIEDTGKIISIRKGKNYLLTIKTSLDGIEVSHSISVNGVCLTVVEVKRKLFSVEAVGETIEKTTMKEWHSGLYVNLERAMRGDTRFGGHLLMGHVDCKGRVEDIRRKGGEYVFKISFPEEFKNFVVEKGSIGVDGVSLTPTGVSHNSFEVHIVPYTYSHTNFPFIKVGDSVNIEFDIIGKYIVNYIKSLNI